ncbi:MAG: hypothetical protein K2L89_01995 [Muribaculaceae bacterium]|nr:hypothetical protein [Muribaculaceae bacterium]
MKRNDLFAGLLTAVLTLGATGCSNDEPDNPTPLPTPNSASSVYFLNQGQLALNVEGSLNILDYKNMTVENNVFQKANHRSLGNTPQCGVRYGNKIYIGTYESNTIEILDARSFTSIKQLRLDAATTGTSPRCMVTDKNKIYITMFDGYVARLDTLSLEIDGRVKVGPNPEKPAIMNNRLYVPNSDGMNWAVGYGETASIIDLSSFTVKATVKVPLNPDRFMAVGSKLFLLSKGDYYDIKGAVYEIDPNIDELQKEDPDSGYTYLFRATDAASGMNNIVYYNVPFNKPDREYGRYNVATEVRTTWTPKEVIYPNAIAIDPLYGYIFIASYVMDGVYPSYTAPGFVTVYDNDLKFIKQGEIGAGPTCIFFDNKVYR